MGNDALITKVNAMNKAVLAAVKKNDSKVKAAMKAAGVKVGQSISPAKMKLVQAAVAVPAAADDKARKADMKRLGIKRFATAAELKALEATDGESTVMPTKAEMTRRLAASKKLANPKAAAVLAKANAESAAKAAPAAKGGAVKGKALKAAAVKPATKNANRGATGEAFCSKCGRDNGRPTSPDCRNGHACTARAAKSATA